MTRQPLIQIAYASSASELLSHEELVDILRVSRENNEAAGVSGALLYSDGNIMQVLEGPADAVTATYARVQRDPRHRQILTLLQSEVDERMFPDWSMGFLRLDDLAEEDREAARSMFELTEPQPGRARRLLASFRNLMPGRRPHRTT